MFYRVEALRPGLTRIWDVAGTAMYLVEGTEKAALLDTGVGVGDLKALVDSLTDKPVTVLLTHGHVDHAMGAGGFEDVRMSPLDLEIYREHSVFGLRRGYVSGTGSMWSDPALVASVTDGDYMEPKPAEALAPLAPGDRVELGGVSVEVLRGQGHTPGSLTMLIPEWRMLLLGDACNQFTFLFDHRAAPVSAYREMLLALKGETQGRFDRAIFSHANGDGPADMIDSVIAVCDEILNGTADNVPFESPLGTGMLAKAMGPTGRADGGAGNVVYNPDKLN